MQHQAQENDPGIESFTCKDLWNKKIHLRLLHKRKQHLKKLLEKKSI